MASNTKVLIVEDLETWRDLYRDLLKGTGFNPYFADSFESAIALIERHFFHVALLDIVLDENDETQEQGMKLLARLKETGEKTGVLMVTAFPTLARMDQAYAKFGVNRFLDKSNLDVSALLDELEKASEGSQAYLEMRRNEDLKAQNLLRRFNPRELEMQLSSRPAGRLLELLRGLLGSQVPLTACAKYERIVDAQSPIVFESHYWSRFVGEALLVRVGARSSILREVDRLKQEGLDVFLETRQSLSGLRYAVPDVAPSDFANCAPDAE